MCGEHDGHILDVTHFGAVGDGKTLNTQAIQKAVDAAGAGGGGTVRIPRGTFLTGTVFLRSGVTLEIHPAGRILGSPRIEDYIAKSWGQHMDRTPWHLLVAAGARDVKITGGGTIDGNGPAFWEPCAPNPAAPANPDVPPGAFGGLDAITVVPARQPDPRKAVISWIRGNKEKRPSPMIEITGCENVRIQDVHITNSAGWLLHLHNSNFVWIRGVRLTSNLFGPNNDGFDITGCHDVMVSDCHLSCCDDAICLKTTPDSNTCERITVTNCVIRTKCVALKFGCAETFHDFRQVTFSNCVVYESSRAIGIYVKEGATIEDVAIANIVCDTRNPFMVNRPIHLDCHRRKPESKMGKIRNVIISNVVCRTDGRILLTSQPESPMENIVLRDIQMVYPTMDDPDPVGRDIPCGQFSPASPEARVARGVVVAENVRNFALDNLMVQWPETGADGRIKCPDNWRFPIKAVNGGFDKYYERREYNTERVPDFHVVWGRNLQGGYIRAPLAAPPRPGVEKFHLQDCALTRE
jgi:hypothetical protein